MVQQLNAKEVKERIFKYLGEHGPSLPVQVAKYLSMNSIFASAFLSEMASDGMIKISDMKVGGSPLYFSPEKIAMLEKFTNSLGSKEREACLLLKEKNILEDASQEPAIRVALRGLKDFAFPFKKDEKIYWRYFLITEEQVRGLLEKNPEKPIEKLENKPAITIANEVGESEIIQKIEEKANNIIQKQDKKETELEEINKELEEKRKELEKIKEEINNSKEKSAQKISKKLRLVRKEKVVDETFLQEVKEILDKKGIKLSKIEDYDKKQVFGRVNFEEKDYFMAAYNKKKIEEEDIIKAHKKALSHSLPYFFLSKGEPSKKTKEAIEAYKALFLIEKIE
jgi:hypothetical protein